MFGPYVPLDRRTCVAPILPARNLAATATFYRMLGFDIVEITEGGGYVIARSDWVELHFFPSPDLDPKENDAGAFLRVVDADATSAALSAAFPTNEPGAQIIPVADRPWGMRQGGFFDIDRNLIQFGAPISHKP
jgi:catechol 2,3-dioxygenase-like lactoylglutathione lyase family enzyme